MADGPSLEARWAESRAPLVARLRDEIHERGPLTFARFMEAALYDPADGYYVRSDRRASRAGDFLSAPEQDPLFGALLARQVAEMWARLGSPNVFRLREDGAGSGALAESLLGALRATASDCFGAVRYEPREAGGGWVAAIHARLAATGLGQPADGDARAEGSPAAGSPASVSTTLDPGIVIANELLDALPVHRLVGLDGGPQELYVDWSAGWFAERPGPPSDPRLTEVLLGDGVVLETGQRTEVCLAALDWVAALGRELRRGYALVIDYGKPAAERHAPSRPGGLLRTYRAHHAGDDPFHAVGEQDLTAHLDWTALERAAAGAGLDVLGRTSLTAFCLGLEAGSLLTDLGAATGTSLDAYWSAKAALRDLLDPRRLGGFGVLILGRGAPAGPPLSGLSAALPRAR